MYHNTSDFLSQNKFQIIFIVVILVVITALFSYWDVVKDSKTSRVKKTVIVEGVE